MSPSHETNGSLSTGGETRQTVKRVRATKTNAATKTAQTEAKASSKPTHQTHGGYTPITGPITNVRQLIRGGNKARGSIGSFQSLASYSAYVKSLTTAELHRHAIEEAHIVAIDDRDRLIRRLESEWSAHNAREADSSVVASIPKRSGFTAEQRAAQEAIRKKLLGHRAT